MARRSDHNRAELKQLALQATDKLIHDKGLAQLSARKVATEIGYTVGTLYNVFDNFDDLILQFNAQYLDKLIDELEAIAQNDKLDAEDKLLKFALLYLEHTVQYSIPWQAIFSHTMQDGSDVPDWYSDKTDALFYLVESQMMTLGKQRKKSTKEIKQAARVVWASVHGICQLSVSGKLDIGGACNEKNMVKSLIQNYVGSWQQE